MHRPFAWPLVRPVAADRYPAPSPPTLSPQVCALGEKPMPERSRQTGRPTQELWQLVSDLQFSFRGSFFRLLVPALSAEKMVARRCANAPQHTKAAKLPDWLQLQTE